MKIKVLKFILIILLPLILAILIYSISENIKQNKTINSNVKHFQKLPLVTLDSNAFDYNLLSDQKPIVIVYFNSTCSICEFEAKSILKNIPLFVNTNLLLISTESLKAINLFAQHTQLFQYDNIHFCQIKHKTLTKHFGNISVPTIYIYDKNRKLVKKFTGETKAEAIIKHIQ